MDEKDAHSGGLVASPLLAKPGVNLYTQLAESLRSVIQMGELRPGDPIPSEHQLCKTHGVSRPTVRRAIEVLTGEGLLTRRQGMGTFVSKLKLVQPQGRVIGFSERMIRNGMEPSTRILDRHVLPARQAAPEVVTALALGGNDLVLRLARLRLANDEPLVLETIHLPLGRFADLDNVDLERQSLYQVLKHRYDAEVTFIRESLEPVLLTPHEAALLRTQPGMPGMLARIVTFDQRNDPIEHSVSLVRGDRCQYEIELAPSDDRQGGGWSIRQTQLEVGT